MKYIVAINCEELKGFNTVGAAQLYAANYTSAHKVTTKVLKDYGDLQELVGYYYYSTEYKRVYYVDLPNI